MNQANISNYTGCLLGGAVGDALGAPTEFMSLYSILEQYGPEGVTNYIEFADGHGEITDDTQMLLFTAEGLLRSFQRANIRGIGGAYQLICHHSYLRWLYTQQDWHSDNALKEISLDGWMIKQEGLHQRRAPGNTCLSALKSGKSGTMEEPINNSKGCGGIMRIAPVGLLFNEARDAFKIGCELAAMTHGHPTGHLSSGVFAAIISYLNAGFDLPNAISNAVTILKDYPGHEETLRAIHKALKLAEISDPSFQKIKNLGEGWIAEEALSISLYCALSYPGNFKKAVILAINHSGDTDSTGALTGNLLGLTLGEEKIPSKWIENLELSGLIKTTGVDLYKEATSKSRGLYSPEWQKKYPS
ncbi:ADP-ribosylglycohydrolase family protein [Salegentibacter maritimus]|uniref:ADP-ribosylglycohydrolase family protein n=1 Tax=Salegentibacter maritimus TaxID=2794347 RepID=UPI0018E3FD8D|nr:ADP-ribosylglycohydrolase family protein [Salegentibacter maritimus]MBI6115997.1 ADP-ribosylglycohydrolase family protein [Salegentibacter maritimus]